MPQFDKHYDRASIEQCAVKLSFQEEKMLKRTAIALLSFGFVFVLNATPSSACDRPGTPQFLITKWTSPKTYELEILNKSQRGEGSLYYEFTINRRHSDRRRIESPHFDQRIKVTLDTNHYTAGTTYRQLRVQMRARRISNDCVSGATEELLTERNPFLH